MEKKIINKEVQAHYKGMRIDKFLQIEFSNLSRTRLQDLVRKGYVQINNIIVYETSKKIREKDKIEINFPKPKETLIKANKIDLDIMYDDNDLIIINKNAGVVVHPGAGNHEKTIVNGLLFKFKKNLSNVGGKLRPGIVHRIDKDTSGVIVVAKNDQAHINLSKQFSNHTIERKYEALVWGIIKPQKGKINENISRSVKNRQLMSVRKDKDKGKTAITNYKTLEIFQNSNLPKISLVECKLETGRTHQIRVHMNYKKSSLIGDKQYGKKNIKFKKVDKSFEKKLSDLKGQALHATTLGFIHPKKNKFISFKSNLSNEFQKLLDFLEKQTT